MRKWIAILLAVGLLLPPAYVLADRVKGAFQSLDVTDNVTVGGTTITDNLSVSGTPIFADNTVNGADLIDNTVTSAKILDNSIASSKILDNTIALGKIAASGTKDSTTYLRGDSTWSTKDFNVCLLSKSAQQDIAGGVPTYITFDVEDSDILGAHNPATDNSKITIPAGYNYVNVNALVWFESPSGSSRRTILYKNGTGIDVRISSSDTTIDSSLGISTGWVPVVAGDNVFISVLSATDNVVVSGTYTNFRAEFK
jgi:hypothetical protein